MNKLLDELLVHKSFLKLTRENPYSFESSTSVNIHGLAVKLIDTGILTIEPHQPGNSDIIISSGIHGNETAPIEICELLIKEILSGELIVNNRLMFIIGNPEAMNESKRFKAENLNRLFCGKHLNKNNLESQRAKLIEKYTSRFYLSRDLSDDNQRYHFDLHTAIRDSKFEQFAISPYPDERQRNTQCFNFFRDSGINTILLAHQAAGTFSYYTSHQFRANAFTVELGKVKPFGENDMSSFSGIIKNLHSLISGTYRFNESINVDDFNLFQVDDEVIRFSKDEFALNIDNNIANFTTFPIGFQLTKDDNGGYIIKSEQQAIVFPNANVPVGQRVALIVSKQQVIVTT